MFYGCRNLNFNVLRKLNMENVINTEEMFAQSGFANHHSLRWNMKSVQLAANMFSGSDLRSMDNLHFSFDYTVKRRILEEIRDSITGWESLPWESVFRRWDPSIWIGGVKTYVDQTPLQPMKMAPMVHEIPTSRVFLYTTEEGDVMPFSASAFVEHAVEHSFVPVILVQAVGQTPSPVGWMSSVQVRAVVDSLDRFLASKQRRDISRFERYFSIKCDPTSDYAAGIAASYHTFFNWKLFGLSDLLIPIHLLREIDRFLATREPGKLVMVLLQVAMGAKAAGSLVEIPMRTCSFEHLLNRIESDGVRDCANEGIRYIARIAAAECTLVVKKRDADEPANESEIANESEPPRTIEFRLAGHPPVRFPWPDALTNGQFWHQASAVAAELTKNDTVRLSRIIFANRMWSADTPDTPLIDMVANPSNAIHVAILQRTAHGGSTRRTKPSTSTRQSRRNVTNRRGLVKC
jgi:hypothetical protein